jgi:hypothetical protein
MAPRKINAAASAASAPVGAEVPVVAPPAAVVEETPAAVVAPATPAPLEADPAVPAPTAPTAPAPAAPQTLTDRLQTLTEGVASVLTASKDLGALAKDMALALKQLHKDIAQVERANAKRTRKAAAAAAATAGDASSGEAAPERKLSGFLAPVLLSDQMYEFLGIEKGTKVARNEATRRITDYVKANNLNDKDDGRTLHPDAKLLALLSPTPAAEEKVTYASLQSLIKHHFFKKDAAIAAAAVPVPEPVAV